MHIQEMTVTNARQNRNKNLSRSKVCKSRWTRKCPQTLLPAMQPVERGSGRSHDHQSMTLGCHDCLDCRTTSGHCPPMAAPQQKPHSSVSAWFVPAWGLLVYCSHPTITLHLLKQWPDKQYEAEQKNRHDSRCTGEVGKAILIHQVID